MNRQLFIIGAPRCGTTSLFNWLCVHPALCGANPKETFFFMDPGHPLAGRHGFDCTHHGPEAWYNFFRPVGDAPILLDATTHHFYQSIAVRHVSSYFPRSKVLLVVREPASRILSSFLFTRNVLGNCDRRLRFSDYAECLMDDKMETIRQRFMKRASYWVLARELRFSRYVEWVTWWLGHLRPERFKVIIFERMQEAPEAVMTELCSWLGLDPCPYTGFSFGRNNRSYGVTHRRVHRWARAFASHVPSSPLREIIKHRYVSWQDAGRRQDDEDVSEALYALRRNLGPFTRQLEEKIGPDVSRYWGEHEPVGSSA